MKIADFFIEIKAKGDLKALEAAVEYQKTLRKQSEIAIKEAQIKIEQLKKETAQIVTQAKVEERQFKQRQQQAKEEAKKPKTLKEYLMAQGKIWSQQNKMNLSVAKGVLQVMGLSGAFMGFAASIVTAAVALDRMVIKLAQANQLYTNFQRQTGLPMRSAMGVAGAMANVDVTMTPEQVMQNMQNLQTNLVGVQFGMGNIAPYQMAGINPFGLNPENMLDTIRKQMKGFAPAYRTFLLQQMGLDPRLGALIDLSDTDYLKYKQEALELYLSPEDRKAIQELAPEWNKLNLKFAKALDKTTLMLMQDFQGMVSVVNHLIDVALRIEEIFNTVLRPLLDVLTWYLKPLYYLLDDIMVTLLGGDSIIRRFLSGHPTKNALNTMFGLSENTGKDVTNLVKTAADIPLLQSIPAIGWTMGAGKKIIMNIENDIKVGSAEDGYKMIPSLNTVFNSAIAQLGGH